ncbi:MAG TPA: phosphatase PAP2 family protein [Pseudoneobacillus sp.]|nr:phosphatase PAP2 family protein [Pseudoneobacillus sp.]
MINLSYWLINILFIFIVSLDYKKDQTQLTWKTFLPIGLLLLLIIGFLFSKSATFWYWIVNFFLIDSHLWNWNQLFSQIPFNDGALFRLYKPKLFTLFMRWVYDYGFILAWGASVIRSFLTRSAGKMIRYTLSSHMLQLPIIVPFYATVMLQEVWYVKGNPDGMARHLSGDELLETVQNCFPSMHTSVSFAILLLALRENGRLFKWGMVTYCSLVIFSTLYLEIHWVLDVLGGILLGYVAVKMVDWVTLIYHQRKKNHPILQSCLKKERNIKKP